MTTRNFRVKNGISVGDIVIDASTNKITGLSTAAPTQDGDVTTKSYVDGKFGAIQISGTSISSTDSTQLNLNEQVSLGGNRITDLGTPSAATDAATKGYIDGEISGLSSTTIEENNTSVVVADTGTGTITLTADGGTVASFAAAATTITASGAINLTAGSDVQIPNDVGVLFGSGGEKIESDGTDLTITSTGDLELTVTGTTTVSGALTVTGDLTVNGTTTTVNSTNTTLDDNLLELNSGAASNANDSGFIIERGSTGDNAIFMWDESADKFTLGTTTATASDTGNLSITTGTLVAATFEGDLTGDVTGNADTATTATTATNVTCTANNSTNETVYITFVDGATGGQGIETDTGLTYNPSTNVLTTTASAAQYSDIAERFEADTVMEYGAVVTLGGEKEITEVEQELSDRVFGVISHKPGYMMNSAAGDNSTHPFVAMAGRTPVKVIGTVNKGDRLVSSSIKGTARAVAQGEDINPFHVIGRALESKTDTGLGMVNCVVRTNN